jgi:hypothetical protein
LGNSSKRIDPLSWSLEIKEQKMSNVVIEDVDQFKVFLASQPLCKWVAQTQREIAAGMHRDHRRAGLHLPAPKNDNAELADALSSMA